MQKYFFDGVSGYMLRHNVSKFSQLKLAKHLPEPARAVIYLQEIEH